MTAIYLGHARRGANAWWRYIVASGLGFALTIALGAGVIAIGEVFHALPADLVEQMQHPDRAGTFFLITGVMFGLVVVGFALAILWVQHKRFTDLLGAWAWRGYLMGFGIWSGVLLAAALIDFALAPSGFAFSAGPELGRVALLALVGLAIQTFAEEFIFRGYLTQGLLLGLKQPLPAALVSGLMFGALHIPNGTPQAVSAAVFGAALSLIAIRTGGIAFGCGLHLANNLFAAVVLVSRDDVFQGSPALFTQNTPQLMWWDAAIGSLAIVALAVVMLRGRQRMQT